MENTRSWRWKTFFLCFCLSIINIFIQAQPGWHAVSPPNVTCLLGVVAGRVAEEVFGAVVDNSRGSNLWHSTDLSNTGAFYPAGRFNFDIAMSKDHKKLAMVGPNQITYGNIVNQKQFSSKEVNGSVFSRIVSQNIEPLGTSGFAAVGRFTNKTTGVVTNGVAYTLNGGNSWAVSDLGPVFAHDLPRMTEPDYKARYGAFPDTQNWYVTAGTFPNGTDTRFMSIYQHRLSARLSVRYHSTYRSGQPWIQFMSSRRHTYANDKNSSYLPFPGAIYRTSNGGQSWTKVFDSNGRFYFNQISCIDATSCYVVGESGNYAVVLATNNSGLTWELKMNVSGPYSLQTVQMTSPDNVYVAGGMISNGPIREREIVGTYYQTKNNGRTWKGRSFNGYGYDLSFKDGIGYCATLFKRFSSIITYF